MAADQVMYFAFLETVRQVSVYSKAQSIMLLKVWHAHNEHQHERVS